MVSKFPLVIGLLLKIIILLSLSSGGSGSGFAQPVITKDWLEQVLSWKVQSFVLSSGSTPGAGLVGANVAIQIRTSAKACPSHPGGEEDPGFCDRHLFLKTLVADKSSYSWRSSLLLNLFWTEFKCYQSLLPELERFQMTARINPGKIEIDPKSETDKEESPLPFDPLPFPPLICGNAVDFSAQNLTVASDFQNVRADPLENFIMLPDLRIEGGFKMLDRFTPIDLLHYQLVIRTLSQVHAVSWAYKEKHREVNHVKVKGQNEAKGLLSKKFSFLKYTFWDKDQETVQQNLEDNLKVFHQAVGTLPDFSVEDCELKNNLSRSLDRFEKLVPDILALYFADKKSVSDPNSVNKNSILRVSEQNSTTLGQEASWDVLTQGDCSISNWMFHYDERGRPDKVMLIDLQYAREGDPMTDLVYAWYTATSSDFRTANNSANEKKLLEEYHRSFLVICAQCQVDPPPGFTLEEVERRFHRAKIFGFLIAVKGLPYRMRPDNNNDNNNNQKMTESFLPVDGTTEPFRGRALDILTEAYHQGII